MPVTNLKSRPKQPSNKRKSPREIQIQKNGRIRLTNAVEDSIVNNVALCESDSVRSSCESGSMSVLGGGPVVYHDNSAMLSSPWAVAAAQAHNSYNSFKDPQGTYGTGAAPDYYAGTVTNSITTSSSLVSSRSQSDVSLQMVKLREGVLTAAENSWDNNEDLPGGKSKAKSKKGSSKSGKGPGALLAPGANSIPKISSASNDSIEYDSNFRDSYAEHQLGQKGSGNGNFSIPPATPSDASNTQSARRTVNFVKLKNKEKKASGLALICCCFNGADKDANSKEGGNQNSTGKVNSVKQGSELVDLKEKSWKNTPDESQWDAAFENGNWDTSYKANVPDIPIPKPNGNRKKGPAVVPPVPVSVTGERSSAAATIQRASAAMAEAAAEEDEGHVSGGEEEEWEDESSPGGGHHHHLKGHHHHLKGHHHNDIKGDHHHGHGKKHHGKKGDHHHGKKSSLKPGSESQLPTNGGPPSGSGGKPGEKPNVSTTPAEAVAAAVRASAAMAAVKDDEEEDYEDEAGVHHHKGHDGKGKGHHHPADHHGKGHHTHHGKGHGTKGHGHGHAHGHGHHHPPKPKAVATIPPVSASSTKVGSTTSAATVTAAAAGSEQQQWTTAEWEAWNNWQDPALAAAHEDNLLNEEEEDDVESNPPDSAAVSVPVKDGYSRADAGSVASRITLSGESGEAVKKDLEKATAAAAAETTTKTEDAAAAPADGASTDTKDKDTVTAASNVNVNVNDASGPTDTDVNITNKDRVSISKVLASKEPSAPEESSDSALDTSRKSVAARISQLQKQIDEKHGTNFAQAEAVNKSLSVSADPSPPAALLPPSSVPDLTIESEPSEIAPGPDDPSPKIVMEPAPTAPKATSVVFNSELEQAKIAFQMEGAQDTFEPIPKSINSKSSRVPEIQSPSPVQAEASYLESQLADLEGQADTSVQPNIDSDSNLKGSEQEPTTAIVTASEALRRVEKTGSEKVKDSGRPSQVNKLSGSDATNNSEAPAAVSLTKIITESNLDINNSQGQQRAGTVVVNATSTEIQEVLLEARPPSEVYQRPPSDHQLAQPVLEQVRLSHAKAIKLELQKRRGANKFERVCEDAEKKEKIVNSTGIVPGSGGRKSGSKDSVTKDKDSNLKDSKTFRSTSVFLNKDLLPKKGDIVGEVSEEKKEEDTENLNTVDLVLEAHTDIVNGQPIRVMRPTLPFSWLPAFNNEALTSNLRLGNGAAVEPPSSMQSVQEEVAYFGEKMREIYPAVFNNNNNSLSSDGPILTVKSFPSFLCASSNCLHAGTTLRFRRLEAVIGWKKAPNSETTKLALGDILAATDMYTEDVLPKIESGCRQMSEILLAEVHQMEVDLNVKSSSGGRPGENEKIVAALDACRGEGAGGTVLNESDSHNRNSRSRSPSPHVRHGGDFGKHHDMADAGHEMHHKVALKHHHHGPSGSVAAHKLENLKGSSPDKGAGKGPGNLMKGGTANAFGKPAHGAHHTVQTRSKLVTRGVTGNKVTLNFGQSASPGIRQAQPVRGGNPDVISDSNTTSTLNTESSKSFDILALHRANLDTLAKLVQQFTALRMQLMSDPLMGIPAWVIEQMVFVFDDGKEVDNASTTHMRDPTLTGGSNTITEESSSDLINSSTKDGGNVGPGPTPTVAVAPTHKYVRSPSGNNIRISSIDAIETRQQSRSPEPKNQTQARKALPGVSAESVANYAQSGRPKVELSQAVPLKRPIGGPNERTSSPKIQKKENVNNAKLIVTNNAKPQATRQSLREQVSSPVPVQHVLVPAAVRTSETVTDSNRNRYNRSPSPARARSPVASEAALESNDMLTKSVSQIKPSETVAVSDLKAPSKGTSEGRESPQASPQGQPPLGYGNYPLEKPLTGRISQGELFAIAMAQRQKMMEFDGLMAPAPEGRSSVSLAESRGLKANAVTAPNNNINKPEVNTEANHNLHSDFQAVSKNLMFVKAQAIRASARAPSPPPGPTGTTTEAIQGYGKSAGAAVGAAGTKAGAVVIEKTGTAAVSAGTAGYNMLPTKEQVASTVYKGVDKGSYLLTNVIPGKAAEIGGKVYSGLITSTTEKQIKMQAAAAVKRNSAAEAAGPGSGSSTESQGEHLDAVSSGSSHTADELDDRECPGFSPPGRHRMFVEPDLPPHVMRARELNTTVSLYYGAGNEESHSESESVHQNADVFLKGSRLLNSSNPVFLSNLNPTRINLNRAKLQQQGQGNSNSSNSNRPGPGPDTLEEGRVHPGSLLKRFGPGNSLLLAEGCHSAVPPSSNLNPAATQQAQQQREALKWALAEQRADVCAYFLRRVVDRRRLVFELEGRGQAGELIEDLKNGN